MGDIPDRFVTASTATWRTHLLLAMLRNQKIVRLPIALYRARLGFLFGNRLMLVEHYGRVSGKRRYAVLELIDHKPGIYFVVSGFGADSNWVKNIRVNPRVSISVGGRRPMAAIARRLDPHESAAVIDGYAREHPHAWRELAPVLNELDEHWEDHEGRMVVAFLLTDEWGYLRF